MTAIPDDRLSRTARALGLERADIAFPPTAPGMTVGLFGGSFNPVHEGHLLVAETALRRLALDRLWWLVTPGNPLKDTRNLAPIAERLAACRAVARDPAFQVTALEAGFRTRFSADTIRTIRARHPGISFVWIMGADNLRDFHRWQRWETIAATVPIAVIDRPGATLSFHSAKTARRFEAARLDEDDASLLARRDPPAWTFIHGPRSSLSSTAIRAARHGQNGKTP